MAATEREIEREREYLINLISHFNFPSAKDAAFVAPLITNVLF